MAAITLHREAATALLAEARREFENAACERWGGEFHDESQDANLEATTEIIGRLGWDVDRAWPQNVELTGKADRFDVEFEFTPETLDWIRRQAKTHGAYVNELDAGVNSTEPGYIAGQVYLLHVLRGIAAQREAVTV
jgi:hypothetical protein